MNSDRCRESLDVDALASRRATLEGEVSVAGMHRLRALRSTGGAGRILRFAHEPVRYRLAFRRDEGGAPQLSVSIRTTVTLRCQRCLEPFDYRIDTRSHFRIVRREEDTPADSNAPEALICPAGRLVRDALIEDEILLALPDIPRHDEASLAAGEICRVPALVAGDANAPSPVRRPFAALGSIFEKRGIASDSDGVS